MDPQKISALCVAIDACVSRLDAVHQQRRERADFPGESALERRGVDVRKIGNTVKGAVKTGATKVGRGLQRVSGPAALAGIGASYAGLHGAGAIGLGGGFAAAKLGRALERAGSGSIKRTTLLGGPSTEDQKNYDKENARSKANIAAGAAHDKKLSNPSGKKLAPLTQRVGAAVKQGGIGGGAKYVAGRVGRAVGNWDDRRRLSGQRKELEWARGGEEDARRHGVEYAKKHGTVMPGYWAGQAKRHQANIKGLEHSIKQRGDAIPAPIRKAASFVQRGAKKVGAKVGQIDRSLKRAGRPYRKPDMTNQQFQAWAGKTAKEL